MKKKSKGNKVEGTGLQESVPSSPSKGEKAEVEISLSPGVTKEALLKFLETLKTKPRKREKKCEDCHFFHPDWGRMACGIFSMECMINLSRPSFLPRQERFTYPRKEV